MVTGTTRKNGRGPPVKMAPAVKMAIGDHPQKWPWGPPIKMALGTTHKNWHRGPPLKLGPGDHPQNWNQGTTLKIGITYKIVSREPPLNLRSVSHDFDGSVSHAVGDLGQTVFLREQICWTMSHSYVCVARPIVKGN